MAHNDRFGDTSCVGVTGKDGKVVWIFKPEDLREVVSDDVYECVISLLYHHCDGCARLNTLTGDDYEKIADGYRNKLVDIMYELRSIIDGIESSTRLNRKKVLKDIRNIWNDLDKNL